MDFKQRVGGDLVLRSSTPQEAAFLTVLHHYFPKGELKSDGDYPTVELKSKNEERFLDGEEVTLTFAWEPGVIDC
jgi:hypothetical protein